MASSVEFTVDNEALAVIKQTAITANFTEMKAWLQETLSPYVGAVVNSDAVKENKKDLAKIRKVKASIDSYRKTVKQEASKNIVEFEEKCKELTGLCDEAIKNIDGQVKAIEAREREAKLNELREYFDSKAIEYPEYITFEDIRKDEWGNKAYSLTTAKEDIDREVRKTALDVQTIMAINQTWLPALLDEYKRSRDVYKCLELNKRYIELAEREEQRKAREQALDEEGIKLKPRKKSMPVPEMVQQRTQDAEPIPDIDPELYKPVLLSVTFEVECTEDELNGLQDFMDSHRINWRVV